MRGISILVPTLNRPQNIEALTRSIERTTQHPEDVEILFGIHEDDHASIKMISALMLEGLRITVRAEFLDRPAEFNLSKLWNELYARAKHNILGFFGDDVLFRTTGWDDEVRAEFENDYKILLHCNDVHQRGKYAALFFTHRKVHDAIGYYMNEKFARVHMDTSHVLAFQALDRVVYRDDILTEHLHPTIFSERADKTYTDSNKYIPHDAEMVTSDENQTEMTRCAEIIATMGV
jgi:hypothetical protein